MKINQYSFGRIIIDGKTYTSDIIIFPDRIHSSWWRKEGHLLQIADTAEIVAARHPVLIVGTGFYGMMKVLDETLQYLTSNQIEVYAEDTQSAVKRYDEVSSQRPTVAALHLTC